MKKSYMNIDSTKEVKEFLDNQRGNWPIIARATGVKLRWMQHLMAGRINEPSAVKVDAILNYKHKTAA